MSVSEPDGEVSEPEIALGPPVDTGLACFVLVVRYLGVPVNAEDIRHRMGKTSGHLEAHDLLRAARGVGLKARIVSTSWDRLGRTPLPAVASLRDGRFIILGGIKEDEALVQAPDELSPRLVGREEFEAAWDGRLLLMARRAKLSDLGGRFGISWFLPAIYKYRRLLGEVLIASFFLQILGLVTPIFFQVVIDKVLVHRGSSTLYVLVIGLVAASVFETILSALRTYVFSHTTNRIDVELGARLFNQLLALPYAYFQARRVGDSVARVRELENIRNFITGSALTLVIDLFFTVVFFAVMFAYSVTLTLIVMATLPLYLAISIAVTPMFRRRLDEKFRRGADNQAFLVESVSGVETIKAMAVEPQMQRRWEEQLAAYVQSSFKAQNLANVASQAVQLISKLTTAVILLIGAHEVINESLTVGELVAFNMLAGRVAAPVLRLAQLWQDFQQTRVSIERLGDILNTPREIGSAASQTSLPPIQGEIRFEHVTFRYRLDGPPAIVDVDFTVLPGQVIGIVGPSGSGKSTMAKLIQRLYVPEAGRVLIDGVDLAMVETAWLRRQIGVVLQENLLLNRSVRENIALADPGMSMDRVIEAAKLAGAHEFILELPNAYDTEIGERGTSLSGGQKQRIAIARALVGDPRILVLDEATSALDYESERVILKNMADIARGRTVIIIAHRLTTIRRADRILTLDRGRLVEEGSHQELMSTGGRYAKLYALQEQV